MKGRTKNPLLLPKIKKTIRIKVDPSPDTLIGKKVLYYDIYTQSELRGVIQSYDTFTDEYLIHPDDPKQSVQFMAVEDLGKSFKILESPSDIFKDMLK